MEAGPGRVIARLQGGSGGRPVQQMVIIVCLERADEPSISLTREADAPCGATLARLRRKLGLDPEDSGRCRLTGGRSAERKRGGGSLL